MGYSERSGMVAKGICLWMNCKLETDSKSEVRERGEGKGKKKKSSPESSGWGWGTNFMGFDPSTMVFETSYSRSAIRLSTSLRKKPGFVGELVLVRIGDAVWGIGPTGSIPCP